MNNNAGSIQPLLIAAAVGAAISWGTLTLMTDDSAQRGQIAALEGRILDLELSLAQKEEALANARSWAWNFEQPPANASAATARSTAVDTVSQGPAIAEEAPAVATFDSQKILRDLGTISDRDPRPFSDKVADLLAANPGPESIAVISQGMVAMAGNPEYLPDYALETLYQSQSNAELKRVAAQVLSMRGNNSLMEKQVGEAQAGLRSDSATERQRTLVELAKTRYAGAANAIAPLLQDSDTGVKLDALLALRATGNQSHIHLVESLANHPDPAVSWLANDVIATLQNLSDKARTRLASADIVAELPVAATQ
jgi:hypothetical protein